MLGYYNYTVILTYVGMLASFTGIAFGMQGNLYAALICLMISGCCDMFDGKIASTRKRTRQEKQFGIQIDSMSDLICFGILPAVILMKTGEFSVLIVVVAGLYVLAALIRLSYFNVDEEERQSRTQERRKTYLGLPVTTVAMSVPLIFLGVRIPGYPLRKVLVGGMVLNSGAFLTPFRLKKPGLKGLLILAAAGIAEMVSVIVFLRGRL